MPAGKHDANCNNIVVTAAVNYAVTVNNDTNCTIVVSNDHVMVSLL